MRLARLVLLLAQLPPPPDPLGVYPRVFQLQATLRQRLANGDGEAIEEAFLELYAHLHGHPAPYTPAERRRVDETGGYWAHAGGLSPILKAPDFVHRSCASIDLGAGSGLQLLFIQQLRPHYRSVQVDISSRLLAWGQVLQGWLGVPREHVQWLHADLMDVSIHGFGFVYLYRPLRPEGPGRAFYQRLARELAQASRPVVVFSVADCLGQFLPPSVECFYSDGQLTCYRAGGGEVGRREET